jgi:hypothetical protein
LRGRAGTEWQALSAVRAEHDRSLAIVAESFSNEDISVGKLFLVPAFAIYIIGSLWAFILCIGIVHAAFGIVGVLLGLFAFPFVLYLAPFYAGFSHGDWFPFMISYGSMFAGGALFLIGSAIENRTKAS